jgi:hypothetical protein
MLIYSSQHIARSFTARDVLADLVDDALLAGRRHHRARSH